MPSRARRSLTRVWAVAATAFFISAWISRGLSRRAMAMPSYWSGLVGLLAIGVALVMSWRGLGAPGVRAPMTSRVLRGVVVVGAILWFLAMLFPFL